MSSHRFLLFALLLRLRLKFWLGLLSAFAIAFATSRNAAADDENAPVHEPHGSSWVSVSAFADHRRLGNHEIGAMATVGLALDRAGPALSPATLTTTADAQNRAGLTGIMVTAADDVTSRTLAHLPITREIARGIVVAAWRASGVGADDDRLDGMITRARISAILPETRLRVMRRITDELDQPAPTSSNSYYYPDSVDTWLEARFTWRLDRLLFVDEEPAVERLRIDRSEARMRIATRVLAVASDWQRAWVDLHTIPPEAPASLDGALRMADAEATLDVLTGGFFSRWRSRASP